MKLILVLPTGNIDRTDLEKIEDQTFESFDAIRDEFPNDVSNSMNIFTLSEFMDACNSTDNDTPRNLRIDISKSWIGYVELSQ